MGTVEFKVTDKLKEYGVTRLILLEDCNMLKAMIHGLAITATYNQNDISGTMKRFRSDAGAVITSNGKDASDIIDDLVRQTTICISEYAERKACSTSTDVADTKVVTETTEMTPEAPGPAPVNCTMEEWRTKLKTKYDKLKQTVDEQLPGLWLPLEFALSVRCILHIKNISLPFIAIILGPPSSNKSLAVDQFKGARHIFTTDQFSPKSFVSHNSGLTEEQLAKIDLLPKIKNKMFLTSELSPLFTTKDEDLANVFGIITRIADGNGYFSDTGAQGHRGYAGPLMFTWLGAAVDIPFKVHKMLSALGPKLYFIRLPLSIRDEEDIVNILQHDDFRERLKIVSNVFFDYLEYLESCPNMEPNADMNNVPRLKWDAADLVERQAKLFIARLSELLSRLRGTVPTWETAGTQGLEFAYSSAHVEDNTRAAQQLYNLARGHALSQGREYVTVDDDLPLIVKVVLSGAASIERVKVINALLEKTDGNYLNAGELAEMNRTSENTAKRVMAEFRALGLADVINIGEEDRPLWQMRLHSDLSWFLTDEFKKLKEDYMPGDFSKFIIKKRQHKKNPPYAQGKNNSGDKGSGMDDYYCNAEDKVEDSNNNNTTQE
jgi:hypothetical protein